MKSLSCISLPNRTQPDGSNVPESCHRHDRSNESHTDDTAALMPGLKGSRVQTLMQILRCHLARPSNSHLNTSELEPSRGWTPLYFAAFRNHEAALRHFLWAGQNPDGPAEGEASPLCVAVEAGHADIVRALCSAGASMEKKTKRKGETPLHIAIRRRQNDILDILLARQPDLNARTATGETALHYAAATPGSLALVVQLLKHGADYEALDINGKSAAGVAIAASNVPSAVAIISCTRGQRTKLATEKELLLKHVEKAQNRFSMNNDLISDIFEAGCDPDSTVLIEAIKRNDTSLVGMFLDKGIDPNRETQAGLRPIFVALETASAQIVQSLVKHRVDVTVRDTEGLTVLQAALESPLAQDREAIPSVFESLLAAGSDAHVPYPDGRTLLHAAVINGRGLSRVAQRLLEHGVDVDGEDRSGCTALHLAYQSRACVEVLLKNGANPCHTNFEGLSPLLFALTSASKIGEPDLEPLVKVSDLRTLGSNRKTALHIAAERGLERNIRLLLRYRAETAVLDSKNRTPLILAAVNHQWSTIPLLATQPGINSWDEDGNTALHYMVTSVPQAPATWKDVATAVQKFCERGVSRSMRDRSGATPLIQAVKMLPEDGKFVIAALLVEKDGDPPGRTNCIGHEDHNQKSALYFAAMEEKPAFVSVLLRHGAPYMLKDFGSKKGLISPNSPANKKTLKLVAEHEWMRKVANVRRLCRSKSQEAILPMVIRLRDITTLLTMGLDPNAAVASSKSTTTHSLLWDILNLSLNEPRPPKGYLHSVLAAVLAAGGDVNALSTADSAVPRHAPSPGLRTRLPLTFLLEHHPSTDIDTITMILSHGAKLSIASPFYSGRYPLHSAVQANRIDVVDELLTRKADLNVNDSGNQTVLHLAARRGYWEIIENLLRCGANVNVRDIDGNSPLHIAARADDHHLVTMLLQAGAQASAVNKKGYTSLAAMKCCEDEEKGRQAIREKLSRAEAEELKTKENEEQRKKQKQQEALSSSEFTRPRMGRRSDKTLYTIATKSISTLSVSTPEPEKVQLVEPKRPLVGSASAAVISHTATPPKQYLDIHKPLPQPRIDSGFGHSKTLPTLDRTKTSLSGMNDARASNTQEELQGWLAMSKVLEKL